MKPRIDAQLKDMIPPLSEEERTGLEQNIIKNGCLMPLIVWQEENILIDGHNRFDICEKHGIEYTITYKSFASRLDAEIWMIDQQLDRRNISMATKCELGLMLEEKVAELAKQRQREAGKKTGSMTKEDIAKSKLVANLPQACDKKPAPKSRDVAAKKAGVSPRTLSKYKKVKEQAPPEVKEKLRTGEMSIHGAYKEVKRAEQQAKRQEIVKQVEMSTQRAYTAISEIDTKYRIIYADPPWYYGNDYTQAMPKSTRPEDHYMTMKTQDICALPISKISLKNAVLFLWVTSPLLEDGLKVCKSWGFTYKTSFVWDKIKHNFGHYNSVRHEFLFVCTKGACTPDNKTLYDSVQSIERTAHSAKPDKFREIIDELYTYGNRIELFSRELSKNWDTWGNEL